MSVVVSVCCMVVCACVLDVSMVVWSVGVLVGQLQMRRRRARLDSGAAGLFALSLESNFGDQQLTCNSSGSRRWRRRLHSQERERRDKERERPDVRELSLTIRLDQSEADVDTERSWNSRQLPDNRPMEPTMQVQVRHEL